VPVLAAPLLDNEPSNAQRSLKDDVSRFDIVDRRCTLTSCSADWPVSPPHDYTLPLYLGSLLHLKTEIICIQTYSKQQYSNATAKEQNSVNYRLFHGRSRTRSPYLYRCVTLPTSIYWSCILTKTSASRDRRKVTNVFHTQWLSRLSNRNNSRSNNIGL